MITSKSLENVKGFTFVQNTEPTSFDVQDTWYNPDTHELKVRTAYGWVPHWEMNSDRSGYALWGWGSNFAGYLSQNDTIDRSSPVQVGILVNYNIISGCGIIKTDGTLWIWGSNSNGRLGQNDTINRSSPVQVGTDTNWKDIDASGGLYLRVIKTDGTLWTWGSNINGQLGLNDVIYRSSPVQIGTDTNWRKIGGFNYLKNDNTLWAFGSNTHGQLGLNDVVHRSSPVQVGTDTNWKIAMGYTHFLAIKIDGTLWACGNNAYGQLGLNDTIFRSSPVQVGTDTNWDKIGIGTYSSFIIKTDGTLWSWGRNHYGQLGFNDIINRSSPVQVGTDTNWDTLITGYSNLLSIIKTDGTLWVCGDNTKGILGLNDTINRSSPVQIGSNVKYVSTNSINLFILKK